MPSKPPYRFLSSVVRVVDGDTVVCDLKLLPDLTMRAKVRLAGVNAPELSTPEGVEAKRFVENLLPPGRVVVVEVLRQDKYGGRWDGHLFVDDDRSLADVLVDSGHAVRAVYLPPPEDSE